MPHRLFSQIHKLLGLVIGVQVLLWISGGLVMSFFDIERVRGEHKIAAETPQALPAQVLPPALQALGRPVQSVTLRPLLGTPAAEVAFTDGSVALMDAATGAPLSPLGEDWARRLAAADYAGPETIAGAVLIEADPPIEYRGALPVWQVTIADEEGTRLYVAPQTGRIAARRNDVWRLFDFFWMLHIMDYEERTDFNHPLLIGAAATALFGALSGLALLFWRLRRRDFSWIAGRGKA